MCPSGIHLVEMTGACLTPQTPTNHASVCGSRRDQRTVWGTVLPLMSLLLSQLQHEDNEAPCSRSKLTGQMCGKLIDVYMCVNVAFTDVVQQQHELSWRSASWINFSNISGLTRTLGLTLKHRIDTQFGKWKLTKLSVLVGLFGDILMESVAFNNSCEFGLSSHRHSQYSKTWG